VRNSRENPGVTRAWLWIPPDLKNSRCSRGATQPGGDLNPRKSKISRGTGVNPGFFTINCMGMIKPPVSLGRLGDCCFAIFFHTT
jgi:hypothetical protein